MIIPGDLVGISLERTILIAVIAIAIIEGVVIYLLLNKKYDKVEFFLKNIIIIFQFLLVLSIMVITAKIILIGMQETMIQDNLTNVTALAYTCTPNIVVKYILIVTIGCLLTAWWMYKYIIWR